MNDKEYEDYMKELNYLFSERIEEIDELLKGEQTESLVENALAIVNKGYKGA